jgi:hypothetical protein
MDRAGERDFDGRAQAASAGAEPRLRPGIGRGRIIITNRANNSITMRLL